MEFNELTRPFEDFYNTHCRDLPHSVIAKKFADLTAYADHVIELRETIAGLQDDRRIAQAVIDRDTFDKRQYMAAKEEVSICDDGLAKVGSALVTAENTFKMASKHLRRIERQHDLAFYSLKKSREPAKLNYPPEAAAAWSRWHDHKLLQQKKLEQWRFKYYATYEPVPMGL